jgi:N utilization substance protein A
VDSDDREDEVKFMDKDIEAIILEEAGYGKPRQRRGGPAEDVIEIDEEGSGSDAYSDADERQEIIELQNDTIDTLVNDSQDASTEGIDNGGWNRD